MTDKRRLAVSYGSFSCVIEGFDDPFNLMRDIISFYHQVSQDEPEFAHFHQIVDMQELKALLEREMGEQIELEPIAGGVFARRIEIPARIAGADTLGDVADELDGPQPDRTAEGLAAHSDDDTGAQQDGDGLDDGGDDEEYDGTGFSPYSGPGDDAFADDEGGMAGSAKAPAAEDGADDAAWRMRDSDEAPGADDPSHPQDMAGAPDGHTHEEGPTDEAEHAGSGDDDLPWQQDKAAADEDDGDDHRSDDDRRDDDDRQDAWDETPEAAAAPIPLHDAQRAGDEPPADAPAEADADHAPASGPIRLQHAISGPRDAAAEEDHEDAPAPSRLTLGAALRLGPDHAVTQSRGDEDDAEAEDAGSAAGAFIDRVAEQDETRELLATPMQRRSPPPPDDETPIDVSIAQIRSDIEASEEPPKPQKTGGLRLGSFLRRKPAEPSDPSGAKPAPEIVERRDLDPEREPKAEKPRSLTGGMLRVIRSDKDAPDDDRGESAPTAEAPRPATPQAASAARAAEPEPEPRPEPEAAPAEAEAQRPERAEGREADPLKSRLHASFGNAGAPKSARESVDLDDGEMQDPYSPRGFAQRVGADSVTELMAAAAAFRILVDGKHAVTRTDIMETVQMIMGDTPLSAEAKVKGFGKLMRGGELTRLDAGEFTLAPELLESFQERFDAARKANAAGG